MSEIVAQGVAGTPPPHGAVIHHLRTSRTRRANARRASQLAIGRAP